MVTRRIEWSSRTVYILLAASVFAVISFLRADAHAQRDALALSASVDKPRYVHSEPVFLTVLLRNVSGASVQVPQHLEPQSESIEVRVKGPDGKARDFVPLSVLDSDAAPVTLEPGGVRGEVFQIFFGARGWTFGALGRYAIHTAYLAPGGKAVRLRLDADPVEIEVVADPAGDLLMTEGRGGDEAGRFLVWQAGDHLRAGIARIEDLIAKYPDSPLTNYCRFALGKSEARHFQDYAAERVRPPDYERAEEYLKRVDAKALPLYLRTQLEITRAQVDAARGRTASGRSHLDAAVKAIEGRPELAQLSEPAARARRAVEGGSPVKRSR